MSPRLSLTRFAAAGLFAAIWMTQAVLAKPPDLPIDTKEDCANQDPQATCVEALGSIYGPPPTICEDLQSAIFQHYADLRSRKPGLILGARKSGHCLFYGLHPIPDVIGATQMPQATSAQVVSATSGRTEFLNSSTFHHSRADSLLNDLPDSHMLAVRKCGRGLFFGFHPIATLDAGDDASQPADESGAIEVVPVMPVEEEQLTVMPTLADDLEKLTVMPVVVEETKPSIQLQDITPDRFISGLTPAGAFTSDLDLPINGFEQIPVMPAEVEQLTVMPTEVDDVEQLPVMPTEVEPVGDEPKSHSFFGSGPGVPPFGVFPSAEAEQLEVMPTEVEELPMAAEVKPSDEPPSEAASQQLSQYYGYRSGQGKIAPVHLYYDSDPSPNQTPETGSIKVTAVEELPMPPEVVPASEPTCPYLKQQQIKQQRVEQTEVAPRDALKNLEKLLDARHAYRMGEFYRNAGMPNTARPYYEMVHQLCPGCHVDMLAVKHLGEIDNELAPLMFGEPATLPPPGRDEGQDEEQEVIPPQKEDMLRPPGHAEGQGEEREVIPAPKQEPEKDVPDAQSASGRLKENLAKLTSQFKVLFEAGKYEEAEAIALQGRELDPDNPIFAAMIYMVKACPGGMSVTLSKEHAIERCLAEPTTVNFINTPLRKVLKDLGEVHDIHIVLDKESIEQEMVDLDYPVTKKLDNISVKSVLNIVLQDPGLAWVVRDGAIVVTTERQARGKPVTRVYAVADLVDEDENCPNHAILAKWWHESGQSMDAQLVTLIKSAIAPKVWTDSRDVETIEFFQQSKTLLVKATPDIQEQVEDLLEAVRRNVQGQNEAEASQPKVTREPSAPDEGEEQEAIPAPKEEPKKVRGGLGGPIPPKRDIGAALRSPVRFNFTDTPLRKVLEHLCSVNDIDMVFDEVAIDEEMINFDRPVTKIGENISLNAALDIILQDTGLTWEIRHDVICVTTKPHGHYHLVQRVYAVADLVDDDEHSPNHEELAKLWRHLVSLIRNAIQPASIVYFPRSKTLLVKATPDLQEQVADLLEALRRHVNGTGTTEESESKGTREPHVMEYPPLPPIDPQTPNGLQAVLVETEDATTPVPTAVEAPGVPETLQGIFDDAVRDAVDAVRSKACLDVDSSPNGLRGQCQLSLGGLVLRVVCDNGGNRCVLMAVPDEAAEDLRAAQWAHNEAVIHWVESVSGNP
jgi:hypothetical protein